ASPTGRPATPADDGAVVLDPLEVRRAAVFGRDQPVLFATTVDGEIRLRRPEDRDIDDLVVGCRDPESIRWTSVPDPYQRGDAEFYVRELAVDTWARGTGAIFAVADPEDRYAGTLDLRISPVDPTVADVGFLTTPAYRGRGYLPAALGALAAWAFTSLGLARIEWRANVGNHASRRAAEKAGVVFEGTARHAVAHRGKRVDAWVAALLPDDLGRRG
ncbi:GNAT family N-acetyltransferase, partial [Micromonospora zhanjiangensis]